MDDLHAIGRLIRRYNVDGDRGRIEALSACFLEDGVLDAAGGVMEGRKAIIDNLSKPRGSDRLEVVRHHLSTHSAEIGQDGISATGRTYFSVLTNIGLDHHGVYVDRYRKLDKNWFIQHRQVRIDWQSPDSLFRALPVRDRGL
ncbi:hypothetical protein C1T17_02725 [Sphingobium sp. SCG-1]|uniref:nuclear transport factor 2 family protein n=1 Tax=Sphingobium sp. SCG-1 TaxID=2072936 RepID=UPI000CD691E8|nr:nuclear transport factor 2 family protein [Sphingobium sp. SCG-1]AUW57160.1 hypothetical protein C1T17_02725 [Sphingobium sp. SCG-1]